MIWTHSLPGLRCKTLFGKAPSLGTSSARQCLHLPVLKGLIRRIDLTPKANLLGFGPNPQGVDLDHARRHRGNPCLRPPPPLGSRQCLLTKVVMDGRRRFSSDVEFLEDFQAPNTARKKVPHVLVDAPKGSLYSLSLFGGATASSPREKTMVW